MTNILNAVEIDQFLSKIGDYPTLKVESIEQRKDIRNLATGVYAPLTGFLKKADYRSVLKDTRLVSGEVWPIPIVLDISSLEKKKIGKAKLVIILDDNDRLYAVLENIEVFKFDKKELAQDIFGTIDQLHPGVEAVYQMKDFLIGGEIKLINDDRLIFPDYNYTPEETKRIFQGRGWNKIVAFQTRNIPHRGHEFLQKQALKRVDGLFVQPIIGEKKIQDFKDEYIISSYERLIHKYYPKNKVVLGVLPLKMRYAGPKEALFHALIRRNYGCTHFIVGRDHAGVGNYYDPYAAQEIFNNFDQEDLGIEIMRFEEVVWSQKRKKLDFINNCQSEEYEQFSGTKIRNYIANQKQPPEHFLRKEVYQVLTEKTNVLVDEMYQEHQHKIYKNHQGFVLWLTGLSQSGKSTIANRLFEVLEDKRINAEILDGDIVRESLTNDLGFSKEDRDENIKRVVFVAKLLSRNQVGTICSFISPYQAQRDLARMKTDNFIEVFVNTPLEVCEKWDRKGFYQKARKGEIKNFTGISAPYEKPKNPDIELKPAEMGVDKCVTTLLSYLEEKKYI